MQTSLNTGQLKTPVAAGTSSGESRLFGATEYLGGRDDGYRDTGGPDPADGPSSRLRSLDQAKSRATDKNGNSLSSPPNTAQAHARSHLSFRAPFYRKNGSQRGKDIVTGKHDRDRPDEQVVTGSS